MNPAQKRALLSMRETGLLEVLRDSIKQELFQMWLSATSDDIRIDLGHKADVVDTTFVMMEEILIETDMKG